MDQTNFAIKTGRQTLTFITLAPILLAVGTGGDVNPTYYRLREAKLVVDRCEQDCLTTVRPGTSADLLLIHSVLKMSVTDISDCVGVTRQTYYNWKAGKEIKLGNAYKLGNLREAAAVLAKESIDANAVTLRRPLRDGKNLFEIVSQGGDGAVAAKKLAAVLHEEEKQSRALAARFADRNVNNNGPTFYGPIPV